MYRLSAERQRDKDVQHGGELSDSEDEGTGGRRNHQDNQGRQSKGKQRPSIMDGGRHHDTPTDEEILARAAESKPDGAAVVPEKDAATAAETGEVPMMDVDVKEEAPSASLTSGQ